MSEKPRLTREQARAEAFFEVEVGEVSFKCRVASGTELMAAGVLPPPIVDPELSMDERQKRALAAAEKVGERLVSDTSAVDSMLAVMMVEPKLWRGDDAVCPDDAVSVAALGPYRDELFTKCLGHIGYAEERRKALDFRDPQEAGAAAAASGG